MVARLTYNRDPIREIALDSLLKDHDLDPRFRSEFIIMAYALSLGKDVCFVEPSNQLKSFKTINARRIERFSRTMGIRLSEMHHSIIDRGFIEYSLLSPDETFMSLFYDDDTKIELTSARRDMIIEVTRY